MMKKQARIGTLCLFVLSVALHSPLMLRQTLKQRSSFWPSQEQGTMLQLNLPRCATNENLDKQKRYYSRVAIIGGSGYIGSYLAYHLHSRGFNITIVDRKPSVVFVQELISVVKADSRHLAKDCLCSFSKVIFLGGCSSLDSCTQLTDKEVEQENIEAVIDILNKLEPWQHFVSTSTAAVSEGTIKAKETDSIKFNRLDTYSLSMMKREKRVKDFVVQRSMSSPRVSMLRLGIVVGSSPAQRADGIIPKFFRDAYTTGYLLGEESHCKMLSILSMHDLGKVFHTLFSPPTGEFENEYKLWNIATTDASVLKLASTIASITGARIGSTAAGPSFTSENNHTVPCTNSSQVEGSSLDTSSFERDFNFSFAHYKSRRLLPIMEEFDLNIPKLILPKGLHVAEHKKTELPCPVCGASRQHPVLDFGIQPLSNDFQGDADASISVPRFPLKLVRCRVCNHYHLSHLVDQNYLLQSGTSSIMSDYFDWLAKKVTSESGMNQGKGVVLELACGDGSQLDHFKKYGWSTYGVDQAKNLAAIARTKGHTVFSGFWPLQFPELPTGNALTAIIARNVLAHVPDVVSFLKGCVAVMGPKTILYVQTSQCNMLHMEKFDIVYHEQISFFTGHSFQKASELAGFEIISFETKPSHGEVCLVTMKLKLSKDKAPAIVSSLQARLDLEKRDWVSSEFLAMKFEARAKAARDWIKAELADFQSKGFHVGGYGTSAKGIVFLNFLLDATSNGTELLNFVVDDAPLQPSKFCPGTAIPVFHIDKLAQLSLTKPLVLVVFAWDFHDEIIQRLRNALKGLRSKILLLLPSPFPKLSRLDTEDPDGVLIDLRKMAFFPTSVPNPLRSSTRARTLLVTHQRNEELLMPFFIIHHASMFDQAIIIDYYSDDETLRIIKNFAPDTWKVVKSKHGQVFDIEGADKEVMDIEKQYPTHWTIALTSTEFLVMADYRQRLSNITAGLEKPTFIKLPIFQVGGEDKEPLMYFSPLPNQRSIGHRQPLEEDPFRFLHYNTSRTYRYRPGRHRYKGKGGSERFFRDAFIMKFFFSPWPECIARKVSIGKQLTRSDIDKGWAFHHVDQMNVSKLRANRKDFLSKASLDLCEVNYSEATESVYLSWRRGFHNTLGRCNTRLETKESVRF